MVHTWLRALPDDIFVRHARLALDAALRLLESLHATADASYTRARIHVEETLARVEDGLRRQGRSPLPEVEVALIRRRLRLLRALIEARALLPRGDAEILSSLAEEIETLSEHEEVRWQMVWVAILFWCTFSIRREGARLIPRLLDVKRRAVQAGEHLPTIRAMLWLAFAYWQAGRLHGLSDECLDGARRSGTARYTHLDDRLSASEVGRHLLRVEPAGGGGRRIGGVAPCRTDMAADGPAALGKRDAGARRACPRQNVCRRSRAARGGGGGSAGALPG